MSIRSASRLLIYAPTLQPRRAKIIYERLIAVADAPGIKHPLRFLMTRGVVHQKSAEKALYSIGNNLPPGKFPRQA